MRINEPIIEDFAYRGDDTIKYLVIGEEVERIGDRAFENSKYLTGVKIEEASKPIHICLNAFDKCKDLVDITIKREVVFYKKIRYRRSK